MRRQILSSLLVALFVTMVSPADAQQARKLYRVGRLSGGLSNSTYSIDAIRRKLRELGYIEGKNIVFKLRNAENKSERVSALANELVRLKVDLIVAGGPNDGLAAKKATTTIPIIFIPPPIPLSMGWLTAWRGQGGTSRDFIQWRMFWPVNG